MPRESDELGQYIPTHYHYHMLQDTIRIQAFNEAILRVVPPGGKVLDLGGGTGVLSFFAAHIAQKIWYVEHNPAMVREARRILAQNPCSDRIEIVEADALDFLPPEPVDVVICEMIHVGMLREKQLPILDDFKRRYQARFGSLPIFLPEAFIQAIQPVQHDFDYLGFFAPTYVFQDPSVTQPRTLALGDPKVYQLHSYADPYPLRCQFRGTLDIHTAGQFNALRVITKNVLTIIETENRTLDWFSQYLIVPLNNALTVTPGMSATVEFEYAAGAPLQAFAPRVAVSSGEAASAMKVFDDEYRVATATDEN